MARRQLGDVDRRFKVAGQPALGQHPQREPDHVLFVEVAEATKRSSNRATAPRAGARAGVDAAAPR